MKPTRGMILPGLLVLLILVFKLARAEDVPVAQVTVADPFVELHTGPGTGYPIFHIVDRGSHISIIKQRTNWIKIRALNGETGWVSRDQMQQTLLPSGEKLTIAEANQSDFSARQWILGATGGEFENAPIISIFTAYSFTDNLAAELSYGQSVGNVSSSTLLKANLLIQPFPEVSYSPFFTLGVGNIKVK
ncbi:MAG: SH3 domain-containing protein, partial [Thiogranum sp.]